MLLDCNVLFLNSFLHPVDIYACRYRNSLYTRASRWIYVSSSACARARARSVTRRVWQLSVYIAWSFARFCLNSQRSNGSVWKANTQNIGYISLRWAFMLLEHEVANIERFFKTRASTHTEGELLSTSLSSRVPSSLPSGFSSRVLFFSFLLRMIARTFGKFPPRSVATGWGTPKTATQTRCFSTRSCYIATSNPRTRRCLPAVWSSCCCGCFTYSWF